MNDYCFLFILCKSTKFNWIYQTTKGFGIVKVLEIFTDTLIILIGLGFIVLLFLLIYYSQVIYNGFVNIS